MDVVNLLARKNSQIFFSSKILALLVWLVLLKEPIDGRVHVAGRGNQS
jgi:hypothetical protein